MFFRVVVALVLFILFQGDFKHLWSRSLFVTVCAAQRQPTPPLGGSTGETEGKEGGDKEEHETAQKEHENKGHKKGQITDGLSEKNKGQITEVPHKVVVVDLIRQKKRRDELENKIDTKRKKETTHDVNAVDHHSSISSWKDPPNNNSLNSLTDWLSQRPTLTDFLSHPLAVQMVALRYSGAYKRYFSLDGITAQLTDEKEIEKKKNISSDPSNSNTVKISDDGIVDGVEMLKKHAKTSTDERASRVSRNETEHKTGTKTRPKSESSKINESLRNQTESKNWWNWRRWFNSTTALTNSVSIPSTSGYTTDVTDVVEMANHDELFSIRSILFDHSRPSSPRGPTTMRKTSTVVQIESQKSEEGQEPSTLSSDSVGATVLRSLKAGMLQNGTMRFVIGVIGTIKKLV